jgi:hypothetical protein
MTPATKTAPPRNERLERRIEEHKAEVARLRAELGDPREALFAFVRSHFTFEDFLPEDGETHQGASSFWHDDADQDDR